MRIVDSAKFEDGSPAWKDAWTILGFFLVFVYVAGLFRRISGIDSSSIYTENPPNPSAIF